ncbi:hypothetical protein [Agromyces subbeticus]|nr:hypothetical protein [Agromyces subbeticus]
MDNIFEMNVFACELADQQAGADGRAFMAAIGAPMFANRFGSG